MSFTKKFWVFKLYLWVGRHEQNLISAFETVEVFSRKVLRPRQATWMQVKCCLLVQNFIFNNFCFRPSIDSRLHVKCIILYFCLSCILVVVVFYVWKFIKCIKLMFITTNAKWVISFVVEIDKLDVFLCHGLLRNLYNWCW